MTAPSTEENSSHPLHAEDGIVFNGQITDITLLLASQLVNIGFGKASSQMEKTALEVSCMAAYNSQLPAKK
jgi:hypothetical protein